MTKKKKEPLSGEIRRSFIKHKVYGTVYAIEGDDSGTVLASAVVTEATACRHTLPAYELTLDEVAPINEHIRDYEMFEPACSDPKHLLDEIGVQERVCVSARETWQAAKSAAKECREIYEREENTLRAMVRASTSPTSLPLFDQAADTAPAEAPPVEIAAEAPPAEPVEAVEWYLDGVKVKRCVVCHKRYPCGEDHGAPPPVDAPGDQPNV